MGKIILDDPKLLGKLESMCRSSTVLRVMLHEILEGGNLEIRLLLEEHSWYDQRRIGLGLKQLPAAEDVESTLIMEICNAWCDIRGMKPLQEKYDTAEAYGEGVERSEWNAIKKHIRIHKDLSITSDSLGQSRFQQAFQEPEHGWDNFEKYLEYQRKAGHTKQIESHWKKKHA